MGFRYVTSEPDTKELVYELEALGDGSSSAYAAVVYLVIKSRITTQDRLIASKTRVAPLKKHTIPRLELSVALILARLTARIKTTLQQCLVISRVRCWTDSKNVLYLVDEFEMIQPPPECVKKIKVQAVRDLEESNSTTA